MADIGFKAAQSSRPNMLAQALRDITGVIQENVPEYRNRLAKALTSFSDFQQSNTNTGRRLADALTGSIGLPKFTDQDMQQYENDLSTALNFAPLGMIAYHGSPHKFDKFSLDKIGTGEGAQAYGHGLYLAEHPEVATQYSKMFDKNQVPATQLQKLRDAAPKGSAEWSHYDDLMKTGIQGSLYKTDIPDEAVARFLDWDKPLSQQAPEVQAAISGYGKATVPAGGLDMGGSGKILSNHDGKLKPGSSAPWILKTGDSLFDLSEKDVQRMLSADKGEAAYTRLTALLGGQDAATQHLKNSGIPGIRYLDGGSRGAGNGTSNFVSFDPEMIRILERNGQPTGNQPWKPGEWKK